MADEPTGTGPRPGEPGRSRLHLRARGPVDERLRRRFPRSTKPSMWRGAGSGGRATRGGMTAGRRLLAIMLLAAVLYSVESKPVANIGGTEVVATRVLVLRDGSGSMGGTGPTLAAQMATALAAGIQTVRDVETLGFGFTPEGDERNALRTLERVLPGLDVDAVYLFSDFDNQTGSLDDSNTEGYNRLRTLLAAERIRLYLSTVRLDPEPGLVGIASASGGGVIASAGR